MPPSGRAQNLHQHVAGADGPGDAAGDQHAHGHQPVDLVHMGAKALVDRGGPGACAGRADRLIFSHEKPPMLSRRAALLSGPPGAAQYRRAYTRFQELRPENRDGLGIRSAQPVRRARPRAGGVASAWACSRRDADVAQHAGIERARARRWARAASARRRRASRIGWGADCAGRRPVAVRSEANMAVLSVSSSW